MSTSIICIISRTVRHIWTRIVACLGISRNIGITRLCIKSTTRLIITWLLYVCLFAWTPNGDMRRDCICYNRKEGKAPGELPTIPRLMVSLSIQNSKSNLCHWVIFLKSFNLAHSIDTFTHKDMIETWGLAIVHRMTIHVLDGQRNTCYIQITK